MKQFLRKSLQKLLNWLDGDDSNIIVATADDFAYVERQIVRQENTVRWTLTPARGGYILIVTPVGDSSKPTRDEDRQTTLYIIADDKNLGETVARLLNLSQLSC